MIILQTGYSDYDDVPYQLLKKPYGLDELRRTVTEALAERNAQV